MIRVVHTVLVALWLSGCALPPSKPEQQFVSQRELKTVQLVREGLSMLDSGRAIEAELKFRQARELAPVARNIRINLAFALESAGQFAEAEAILDQLQHELPDSSDIMNRRAHLAVSARQFARAKQLYRTLYDRGLTSGDPRLIISGASNLSALLFRIGEEEDAQCFAAVVATLKPGAESLRELARIANARGIGGHLIPTIDAQLATADDPQLHYAKALALLSRREDAAALDQAREASQSARFSGVPLPEARILEGVLTLATGGTLNEPLRDDWHELLPGIDLASQSATFWPPRYLILLETALQVTR